MLTVMIIDDETFLDERGGTLNTSVVPTKRRRRRLGEQRLPVVINRRAYYRCAGRMKNVRNETVLKDWMQRAY